MNTTDFIFIPSLPLGLCVYLDSWEMLPHGDTGQPCDKRHRFMETWLVDQRPSSIIHSMPGLTLAEYCVHVPLILHGHILGARIQCATVVGWPKEGGAKAINNWLGVVSSLNGSYIYCTYWTKEAKLTWLFWLSLQNPFGSIYFTTVNLGGQRKNQL